MWHAVTASADSRIFDNYDFKPSHGEGDMLDSDEMEEEKEQVRMLELPHSMFRALARQVSCTSKMGLFYL